MAVSEYIMDDKDFGFIMDIQLKSSSIRMPEGPGTPTYSTVEDYIKTTGDSGKLTGGDASDDADGTITMSAMTGLIYTTDSPVGELVFFDIAETALDLTDNALNYIYAQYNSGTPRYQVTVTETDISGTDEFVVDIVWREGTDLHIGNVGKHIDQFPQQVYRHSFYLDGIERMWGILITDIGSMQLRMSTGALSWAFHELAVPGHITASFKLWYNDGAWQEGGTVDTLPGTQYNDFGTGLADLTSQRYGIYWMYVVIDGDLYGVYGTGDYKLAEALAEPSPGDLPPELANIGVLIAKVIFQKSAGTIYSITIPWEDKITGSGATDHGSLAGLEDVEDHAYALLLDGTRALTGLWNTGAYGININDADTNANMTIGLTINQGANDDEILAFKSSDIAHGVTTLAETDTYAQFKKQAGALGGLKIVGYAMTGQPEAITIIAYPTDGDTTKDETAEAAIRLNVAKISGTGVGSMGANENLVSIEENGAARWLLDEDGDSWQSGGLETEDTALIQTFAGGATDNGIIVSRFSVSQAASASIMLRKSLQDTEGHTTNTLNDPIGKVQFGGSDGDSWGLGAEIVGTTEGTWSDASLPTRFGFWACPVGSASLVELMRLSSAGLLTLNETANAKMTIGLTINQGANDDEILAFKSSDIAHGVTDIAETDTYAAFQKEHANYGGLRVTGIAETPQVDGIHIRAIVDAVDTTKNTSSEAAIRLNIKQKSGTGVGVLDQEANLVSIEENSAARWLLDEDGDTWQTGNVYLDGSTATLYGKNAADDGYIRMLSLNGSDAVLVGEADVTSYVNIKAPLLFIGDSKNTKMSSGLTIRQVAYDDEILAFKSTDVVHLCTAEAEEDTYGTFAKATADVGGIQMMGYTEGAIGMALYGRVTTEDTTKGTARSGAINIIGQLIDDPTTAALNADVNIVAIKNHQTTVWIVDSDGDTWQGGSISINSSELTEAILDEVLEIGVLKSNGLSTASVANAEVDLTWDDTPEINTTDITITDTNVSITIATTGTYVFDVTAVADTASARVTLHLKTYKDTGGGYAELTSDTAANYAQRDADQTVGGVSLSTALDLDAGDKVKFSCTGNADGTTALRVAGTILRVIKLK